MEGSPLNETDRERSIREQCARWRGLSPKWYKLLVSYVQKNKDRHGWRERFHWFDMYWSSTNELKYKVWFEALERDSKEIDAVYCLLDAALDAYETAKETPATGPDRLNAQNIYLVS
jgi:hypothetical protein